MVIIKDFKKLKWKKVKETNVANFPIRRQRMQKKARMEVGVWFALAIERERERVRERGV